MKFQPRKPIVMNEAETLEHMLQGFSHSPRLFGVNRDPKKGDPVLFDCPRTGALPSVVEHQALNGGLMLRLSTGPTYTPGQLSAMSSGYGMILLVPVEEYPEGMTHLKVVSVRSKINDGALNTHCIHRMRDLYGKPGEEHPMWLRWVNSSCDQDGIGRFDRQAVEWYRDRISSMFQKYHRTHINNLPDAIKDVTSAVAVPVIGHLPTVDRFTLHSVTHRDKWWEAVAGEPWFKPSADYENWKREYAARKQRAANEAVAEAQREREVTDMIERRREADLQELRRRFRLNR